jgi:hypothetical protein
MEVKTYDFTKHVPEQEHQEPTGEQPERFRERIAVFGSRVIDTKAVFDTLVQKMDKESEYITSGNIAGAALMALRAAQEKGVKITLYNYEAGLGAFYTLQDIAGKNKKMIAACDKAYVFWNGESKGTQREIEMLKKAGKPFELIMCEKRRKI